MHPVKMIAIGILAWPLAEIAAFMVVATLVGVSAAFVLLILVSFAGLLVLRQVGGGAVARMRTAAGSAKIAGVALDGTGMAVGLGGILLVIPGFITGLLGAMVMFRVPRRWLLAGFRRLFSARRRPSSPEILDLAADEWQPLPNPKLPPLRGRREGRGDGPVVTTSRH